MLAGYFSFIYIILLTQYVLKMFILTINHLYYKKKIQSFQELFPLHYGNHFLVSCRSKGKPHSIGPTKVITVCNTPPYGHAPTYQISLTYL
jgi:hypothetical protein